MKYRVWLRDTAYYRLVVEAATEDEAIHLAKYSSLPKPYDYSAVIATKVEVLAKPRSSRYKPGYRRRY